MKLFSILAISASALNFKDAFNDTSKDRTIATTFDEALGHLETRFRDMELRQIDNSEKILRKSTMRMYRLMKRWSRQPNKQRLGCFIPGMTVPYDTALTPFKKCDVGITLLNDVYVAGWFFAGSNPGSGIPEQCRKFNRRIELEFYNKYVDHFNHLGRPSCDHL